MNLVNRKYPCRNADCQLCNYPPKKAVLMSDIEKQSVILHWYLSIVNQKINESMQAGTGKAFKLVICGMDPYVNGAIGIPFAKMIFSDMFKIPSGRRILTSLGVDKGSWKGKNPLRFFIKMLNRGVVFLNMSYACLNGAICYDKHKDILKCAYEVNSKIMESAKNVIICGDKMRLIWNKVDSKKIGINPNTTKMYFVPHPASRHFKKLRRKRIFKIFWSKGALTKKFSIF